MKECYYSSCCILSFMTDFLNIKGSFLQLVGVRRVCVRKCVHTMNYMVINLLYVCIYFAMCMLA